jgi:hypothetical protein
LTVRLHNGCTDNLRIVFGVDALAIRLRQPAGKSYRPKYCTSVGTVPITVHRFSANLLKTVNRNFEAAEKSGAPTDAGTN